MSNQLYCVILFAAISLVASKYDIELQSFEVLSDFTDKDMVDPGTLRIKQVRRNTFVLTGYVDLLLNLGKNDEIYLEHHNKTSTGYVQLYQKSVPMCDVTQAEFYPKLVDASNLPPKDSCPVPAANYTIKDLVIDETCLPEILPTGESFILMKIMVEGKSAYAAKLTMAIRETE